jgi:hypothetical protein
MDKRTADGMLNFFRSLRRRVLFSYLSKVNIFIKHMESVTVEKAITRGNRRAKYPAITIAIVIILLTFLLAVFHSSYFLWIFFGGIALSFSLAWMYYEFVRIDWQIWAFNNVRNVHELKKRGIQENLIDPDDKFFNKKKIKTLADKEKWDTFQAKFKQRDVFNDDLTVPDRTIIYFSKRKQFFLLLLICIAFTTGIYLLIKSEDYLYGTGTLLFGFIWIYVNRNLITLTPQIIINDKGIQTSSTPFQNWSNIWQEEVISQTSDDTVDDYIIYYHPKGKVKLLINDFGISLQSLNRLLILYRNRYNNQNRNR